MFETNGFILLKYIANKDYLDDFLHGHLYMNSLYYFWNEYYLELVKKRRELIKKVETPNEILEPQHSAGQIDLFEGTVATCKPNSFGIDPRFAEINVCDMSLRAIGYRYCNVLCFYRLDLSFEYPIPNIRNVRYSTNSNMNNFGKYVIAIKDTSTFFRKVDTAIKSQSFDYVAGDVTYHSLKKDGKPASFGHTMTLKAEMEIDIQEKDYQRYITSRRDCFDKSNNFSYQNEWRVALYRGVKDTSAYTLEVGDLHNCLEWFPAYELEERLKKLIGQNHYCSGFPNWRGTVSRKELREKFYNLGDNKAEPLSLIG